MSTVARKQISFKAQIIAALAAIVGAVVLPQIFHTVGAVSGLGTALGEAFLPMHLPIILVGMLAGPCAGALAGVVAPLVSFAISGMPSVALLGFMMIELCVYGLASGLLRSAKMPTFFKLLTTQIAGRAVRAGAILFSTYALGSADVPVSIIWTSITAGLFGILLQWILLPLIVYRAENK